MPAILFTWAVALGLGLTGSIGAAGSATAGSATAGLADQPAPAPEAAADTLRQVFVMPRVVITASRLDRMLGAGQVQLGEQAIEVTDGRAIADLAPLLPSTKANVNSRGEALFMVRGASERHVPVFLEGIPLTVPWDERADLSMIPTDAIAGVDARRGVHSVLDGPNALAGVVHLVPAEQLADGQAARVTGEIGEGEHFEAHTTYTRRQGGWHTLAALAHRQWESWLVPADLRAPHHQSARRSRTNSDLAQTALTVRVGREWSADSRISLLVLAADGSKGVPPETHLGVDDARFWRYPEHQRAVLGVSGEAPLDAGRRWDLQASASFDLFRQEIHPYDDASYTTPVLVPDSVDYETDNDQTAYAQVQIGRRLGESGRVAAKGVARYTRHGESLVYRGPELFYSEWLTSLAMEGAREWPGGWRLTAGAGIEGAATPETGDKPSRDAVSDPVLHGRVERRWSTLLETYASASRRSRFPSLRELYSGALGKFIPNPDLDPERQDLYELGALIKGSSGEVGIAGFAGYLHGGIEKVSRDGKQQRVNVHEVRTLGLEFSGGWRPASGLRLQVNHTILQARREEDGDYRLPAEDRPDYTGAFTAAWSPAEALDLRLEATAVGPRHSLDATDETDGLRRLPAQGTWNLRIARSFRPTGGPATYGEVFLRLNNLFDQIVEYQAGLPEPGRMLLAGVKLDLEG